MVRSLHYRIIAGVNMRISRVTHKDNVDLLTSVSHAKRLDEKNGNTLWIDAINKEMENLEVSFDVLECGTKIPLGHHKASCHLVFDARVSLECKYR